jgi:hypothetical protein
MIVIDLLALVFVSELIKSIHLYSGNGSVTAIQREFLFSSGVYAQISEPMPSYLNKFAPKNAEQFLKTLKNLNEADMWHCLLEYRDHTPQATSIIPLLSVSKNPALQHIPTLAEDLALVEGAVQRQQQGHHFMAFVHPSGWNEQQHYPPCNSQISCECTSYTKNPLVKSHSVLSPLTVEAVGIDAFKVDEFSNDIHQQVENLHEWGADSEFVSPHMLETCTHDSSWSTSLPLTALLSAQSPTPSMLSRHKADSTLWSPSSLVLGSQITGTFDF